MPPLGTLDPIMIMIYKDTSWRELLFQPQKSAAAAATAVTAATTTTTTASTAP
jgi:hypothetical protein